MNGHFPMQAITQCKAIEANRFVLRVFFHASQGLMGVLCNNNKVFGEEIKSKTNIHFFSHKIVKDIKFRIKSYTCHIQQKTTNTDLDSVQISTFIVLALILRGGKPQFWVQSLDALMLSAQTYPTWGQKAAQFPGS